MKIISRYLIIAAAMIISSMAFAQMKIIPGSLQLQQTPLTPIQPGKLEVKL